MRVLGNLRITADDDGPRVAALEALKRLNLLSSEAEKPPSGCLLPSVPSVNPPPPPRLALLLPPTNPSLVLSVPTFLRPAASNFIASPRPWYGFATAAPALPPPPAPAAAASII